MSHVSVYRLVRHFLGLQFFAQTRAFQASHRSGHLKGGRHLLKRSFPLYTSCIRRSEDAHFLSCMQSVYCFNPEC